GDRSFQGTEPERHLLATHRGRNRCVVDANQDESPGRVVHAAGRAASWRSSIEPGGLMTTPHPTLERSADARAHDEQAALTRTAFVGFATIVIREFNRIIRIWGQTIVPPAITATLYFVIFGNLIGRRVGDMGGYSYIQYIAPGLIMMSVITNSYGNVVSSFFGAKFGKHIEELLVSPLPNWLIVTGYMMGGIARGLVVGGVVTIITLLFTH